MAEQEPAAQYGGRLDEHILKDMGAPDWLVSEASVSREFKRLRNIDYFRW